MRYQTLCDVAAFINWLDETYELEPGHHMEMIATEGIVESFVNQVSGHATSTQYPKAIRLTRLSRALRERGYGVKRTRCHTGTVLSDVVNRQRRPRDPYSHTNLLDIETWIACRPTDFSRAEAGTMVDLALGAGIVPAEMVRLRASDVEVDDHGVLIHAPGTQRLAPRIVPMTSPFDTFLARSVSGLSADDYLVRPNSRRGNPGGDGVLIDNFAKVTTASRPGGMRPRFLQLRQTWLVDHIAAWVNRDLLCEVAGVTTLKEMRPVLVRTGRMTDEQFTRWHRFRDPAPAH